MVIYIPYDNFRIIFDIRLYVRYLFVYDKFFGYNLAIIPRWRLHFQNMM